MGPVPPGAHRPPDAALLISLYVDGACIGNPGPGGYAALLIENGAERRITGGFRRTTNNRMEMMAVIAGLDALPPQTSVTVFCDSLYVVKAINKGWARKWQAAGWMRTPKERALNSDLWERLLSLCARHDVRFQWVRGHANDARNVICDTLARAAATVANLQPDVSYETEDEGSSRDGKVL